MVALVVVVVAVIAVVTADFCLPKKKTQRNAKMRGIVCLSSQMLRATCKCESELEHTDADTDTDTDSI